MPILDMDDDSDPITASYDIFIKPDISEARQIYVLQFPNRDEKERYAGDESKPLTMRIKPDIGMVEMDVPVDAWHNYDKGKGLKWGDALRKSNISRGGGSHGLPGGFGIGSTGAGAGRGGGGRGRAIEDEDAMEQRVLGNYLAAVQAGQVLTKQTLGGQAVPVEAHSPQYMVGTFRNNQLHMTPVDKVVQMRPQFHHIDAHAENERTSRARESGLGRGTGEPRAIHMTVKSNIDGEEETSDSMSKRIIDAQSEAWKHHAYIDEDEDAAWHEYQESMFVGVQINKTQEDVLKGLPKLQSSLTNSEYLDTISAPRITAKPKTMIKKEKTNKGKGIEGVEEGVDVEEDTFSSLSDPPSDTEMTKNDII